MEDRSHQVLAVAVLFISLTWLTVGLRCYVRIGMLKSFGYDDYMMLITQVRPDVVTALNFKKWCAFSTIASRTSRARISQIFCLDH